MATVAVDRFGTSQSIRAFASIAHATPSVDVGPAQVHPTHCPAAIALARMLYNSSVPIRLHRRRRRQTAVALFCLASVSSLLLLLEPREDIHEAFKKPPRSAFRDSHHPSLHLHPHAQTGQLVDADVRRRVQSSLSPAATWVIKSLGMLQPVDPTIGMFREWEGYPKHPQEKSHQTR